MLIIRLLTFRRKPLIYGGIDYSYLIEQGLYTKVSVAIAIITSISSVAITLSYVRHTSGVVLLLLGILCIIVAALMVMEPVRRNA